MIYRQRRRLSGLVVKAVLVVLPVFLLFSVVWLRSNLTALEYELGQLQLQKARLLNENRELIARKAELTSAKTIELRASREMGLAYPDRRKVFYIKTGYKPIPYTTGMNEGQQ
jgi:cell division protein FtsL